jgi:hypothetical protein
MRVNGKRYRVWVVRNGFELSFEAVAEDESAARKKFEDKGEVRLVVEIR